MKPRTIFTALSFVLFCSYLRAQETGVLGEWREPSGSVIRIEACGNDICAVIAQISTNAPVRVDAHNPDSALRQRSLCGLRIGEGFKRKSPVRADGGTLYDPKSGKTYRGSMESEGDQLSLRGYIGFSFLGRTEKWTRSKSPSQCLR